MQTVVLWEMVFVFLKLVSIHFVHPRLQKISMQKLSSWILILTANHVKKNNVHFILYVS